MVRGRVGEDAFASLPALEVRVESKGESQHRQKQKITFTFAVTAPHPSSQPQSTLAGSPPSPATTRIPAPTCIHFVCDSSFPRLLNLFFALERVAAPLPEGYPILPQQHFTSLAVPHAPALQSPD